MSTYNTQGLQIITRYTADTITDHIRYRNYVYFQCEECKSLNRRSYADNLYKKHTTIKMEYDCYINMVCYNCISTLGIRGHVNKIKVMNPRNE